MSSLFPLPSPLLPPFDSLLLKGKYHASAPIHLCLTHLSSHPGTKAIVLTPSRQKWLQALCDFNDDWLNECGGYGAVSHILSQVDVFYPPSPAHLCLVLSMLRTSESTDNFPPLGRPTLDRPPSLLVLHEISGYFDETLPVGHTASSYVSLVAHSLSASFSLSKESPDSTASVVLMDSGLDQLKLPIIPHPGPIFTASEGEEPTGESSRHKVPVAVLVEQYFQWVGTVESLTATGSHAAGSQSGHKLSLHLNIVPEDNADTHIVWEWYEKPGHPRGFSDRPGVVFDWP